METPKQSIFKNPIVQSIAGIASITIIVVGVLLYKYVTSHISIDNSLIQSPVISIGPETSGTLEEVYVKAGEKVAAGDTLARVGAETLQAKVPGIIIEITNTPGQVFSPSQPIIKMIDPREFRVVGTIKENDGLANIAIGDPVSFTVDAFDGATYTGVVDSISPTSKQSGVAFSISDKREIKEFEVNVKFDVALHPEFKNGMSAKMKIYKK